MGRLKRFFQGLFPSKRSRHLKEFEDRIQHSFAEPGLFFLALSHKSISGNPQKNYERLEFLGDAVLELILSEWLLKKYPKATEGDLTKKRSILSNHYFLAKIGEGLGLQDALNLEKNMDLRNKTLRRKLFADTTEAIIAALYLDGGLKAAQKFVSEFVFTDRNLQLEDNNYKGQILERVHVLDLPEAIFSVVDSKGPKHSPNFTVELKIGEHIFYGEDNRKKDAEQKASQKAIEFFEKGVPLG